MNLEFGSSINIKSLYATTLVQAATLTGTTACLGGNLIYKTGAARYVCFNDAPTSGNGVPFCIVGNQGADLSSTVGGSVSIVAGLGGATGSFTVGGALCLAGGDSPLGTAGGRVCIIGGTAGGGGTDGEVYLYAGATPRVNTYSAGLKVCGTLSASTAVCASTFAQVGTCFVLPTTNSSVPSKGIVFNATSTSVGTGLIINGNAGTTNGGAIIVTAGAGGSGSAVGGAVTICAGLSVGVSGTGGAVNICAGVGTTCGNVSIFSGTQVKLNTTTTGVQVTGCLDATTCMDVGTCAIIGTDIVLTTGADRCIYLPTVNGTTYGILINGQSYNGSSAGVGGSVVIRGGTNTATSASPVGGSICIVGGNATNTGGVGGNVCIVGGVGQTGNQDNSGDIYLLTGLSPVFTGKYSGSTIHYQGNSRLFTTNCGVTVCGNMAFINNVADRIIGFSGSTSGTGNNLTICAGASSNIGGNVIMCAGAGGAAGGVVCIVGGISQGNNSVRIYDGATLRFGTTTIGACVTGIFCATTCGTSPDWVATSDKRLKTNIRPLNNSLSIVEQLCGVCYYMCDDINCENNLGFIAQDVELVLPAIVSHITPTEDDAKYGIIDDKLGLKYDKLTAVLVEAIKEQQKMIYNLCSEINNLKYNRI
jgi:hypothetical protein